MRGIYYEAIRSVNEKLRTSLFLFLLGPSFVGRAFKRDINNRQEMGFSP